MCARCTRSWCSRPVCALRRSSEHASVAASRQNSERAAADLRPSGSSAWNHAAPQPDRIFRGNAEPAERRIDHPVLWLDVPGDEREIGFVNLAPHRHRAETRRRFRRARNKDRAARLAVEPVHQRDELAGGENAPAASPSSVGLPSGRVGCERTSAGLSTTRKSACWARSLGSGITRAV